MLRIDTNWGNQCLGVFPLLLLLLFSSPNAQGQLLQKRAADESYEPCGTTDYMNELKRSFPEHYDQEAFERTMQNHIQEKKKRRSADEPIYRIPVVVHVVSDGFDPLGYYNYVSSKQVVSQIVALNDDFRRRERGYNEHESGADTRIEFFLATHDPQGNLMNEPGIDRVTGRHEYYATSQIEEELKPNTQWNPRRYLNIWVVGFSSFMGMAGYAHFPSGSGLDGLEEWESGIEQRDGVVINRLYFGTTGTAMPPHDLGRTTTHEVGHWLGLRHIWGDGGCEVDDYCADTPNAAYANRVCRERTSCGSRDMIENYMDYTPGICKNIFTRDQKDRMRTALEVSPRRKELIQNRRSCSSATQVTAGEFLTQSVPQYYRYTAAADEMIAISSLDATTSNTLVKIYDTCEGHLIASNDNTSNTDQSFVSLELKKDQEIIILWDDVHSAENFQWTLNRHPLTDGSACANALQAQVGEHALPANQDWLWYTWVHESVDTKVAVYASGAGLDLFSGQCDGFTHLQSATDSMVELQLKPGDTCYLLIKGNLPDRWQLNVLPQEPGETCETAQEAEEGTNQSLGKVHWSYFTAPTTGELFIYGQSNSINPKVTEVYKACGQERIFIARNTGLFLSNLDKGETMLIKWSDPIGEEAFEWKLEFTPKGDGESCVTAYDAHEGWNSLATDSLQEEYWFRYVVPEHTSRVVFDFEEGSELTSLDLYTQGNCGRYEDNFWIAPYPWNLSPEVAPNDTLYMLIRTDKQISTLNWKITPRDAVGDRCDNPQVSYEGINESATGYGECWTTFTMPRRGDLTISTLGQTDLDTYLLAQRECDGAVMDANDDIGEDIVQSELSFDAVEEGSSFIFHWVGYYSNAPFQWEITIKENENAGAFCAEALPAMIDDELKTAIGGQWHQLIVPESGDLLITSQGYSKEDTYLKVYSNCEKTLLAANDDKQKGMVTNLQSELLLENVEVGQELFIHWDGRWSKSPFGWKATMTKVYEAPQISDQSFDIKENSLPYTSVGQITALDTTGQLLTYEILEGNEEGVFLLDNLTGALEISEKGILDYDARDTYHLTVQVANEYASSQAVITVSVLEVDELAVYNGGQLAQLYPNPVRSMLTISLDHKEVVVVEVSNLCGSVLSRFQMSGQEVVDMRGWSDGIYFIKLHTPGQTYHQKIIKH